MRLFVAVDLTDEARRAVAAEQKRLVAGLGAAADSIRWVQPDQMHLTLVFLGEVDDARVPAVVEMCHRPLDTRPFELEFAGIGVFPPRGAPRALWIGVGDGTEYLVALQRNVAARTKNSGFAGDAGAFRAHLTIGRWRRSRPSDRARVRETPPRAPVARQRVDRVTLYRSELPSVRHAGPTYTVLAHANLTRG